MFMPSGTTVVKTVFAAFAVVVVSVTVPVVSCWTVPLTTACPSR